MIEALSKDATNKTAYYAGRCTGDVVITAVGGVEFVYGLITTISGGSGSAAALATGIGIAAEPVTIAVTAEGVVTVVDGVNTIHYGITAFKKDADKGKEAKEADSKAAESGSSSIVEIVDEEKGTFIIKDWSDYPDDYVPVPDQNKVWTFLEGDEYNSARDSANIFNRNMRAADPYYANNGLEIHEIEPVKMGGSPTDINNKTAIQSQVHRRYVTPWWNKIRDEVKKGLN